MLEKKVIAIRLIVSAIFGGLIGTEREVSKRPAGLRTHTLVTVGSTLIMIVSLLNEEEPFRLAAQVVSGIGFLGAGTIIQRKGEVDGLTTAASLWVSAGIGLAVGVGQYFAAIVVLVIVLFSLMGIGIYERIVFKSTHRMIYIQTFEIDEKIDDIKRRLINNDVKIKSILRMDENIIKDGKKAAKIKVNSVIPRDCDIIELMDDILEMDCISSIYVSGVGKKEK